MKEIKHYTEANRAAWNEVTPKHQAAAKEKLDRLFLQRGYSLPAVKEIIHRHALIEIAGKDVIHLCCNNGSELLSLN